jgi:phenylpropionate dioxygenase-like ring-hydroxylating dioxygenase large terminal subunit
LNGCNDSTAINAWYVLGAICELPLGQERSLRLLDSKLTVKRESDVDVSVWLGMPLEGRRLPCRQKFGYVWTTLGVPTREIFDIPEYEEPDRRNMNAASVAVHVSAPRAVENFLDLGHFAFVHTDYLGVEPYTEIKPYRVEVSADGNEVLATQCWAYQPVASLSATEGFEVEYTYRVPHPYCALLYKSVASDPKRKDVIGLLGQPTSEEHVVVHMLISMLDESNSDAALRAFAQFIFAQDRPILENQLPKRLPLDLRCETSARADAMSAAYRRWLNDRHVRYGTVPIAH